MSIRTSNEIGVLKVNPIGTPSINYFFCVFDLPIPEGDDTEIYFDEGQYDPDTNTLSYGFTAYTPADPEVTATYKLPIFLEQYYEGNVEDPINIVNVTISGTVGGTTKSGEASEIKTTHLDLGLDLLPTTETAYSENYIRPLFLISETEPESYFLILFAKTTKGNSKLLHVEVDQNDSSLLVCSYTTNNNVVTSSPYICAAHMLKSTFNQYSKVKMQGSSVEVPLHYPILI